MKPYLEQISHIIRLLQSGVDFYEEALEKIDDKKIKTRLFRVQKNKELTIIKLQSILVKEEGAFENGVSPSVEIRRFYTHLASFIGEKPIDQYLENLREVEEKVLYAIDEAFEVPLPQEAKNVLETARKNAHEIHGEMVNIALADN